jgi:hypothetical protein
LTKAKPEKGTRILVVEGDDRTLVALFDEAERRLGEGPAERYGRLADEIDARSEALALRS